ncbi:MAG: translation initiation factor IF-2, partial [Anaerolineae bacterium]
PSTTGQPVRWDSPRPPSAAPPGRTQTPGAGSRPVPSSSGAAQRGDALPGRSGQGQSRPPQGQNRPGGSQGGRSGGSRGPHTGHSGARPAASPVVASAPVKSLKPTFVEIPPAITVRDLAQLMQESPIDLIKVLMNYGIMAPITQTIDFGTATVIGSEFGVEVKPIPTAEPEGKSAAELANAEPKTLRQRILESQVEDKLIERPPVVAVLGHVDHGKTTLLDAIRKTNVVEGEAGGITQRIGAYQVELNGRKITFLDTPGHEAFTAMRARGAQVTDIVVLVVAADDGVMPQTKEAISHAKAAKVPIVVAMNKVDKPNANPDRVKQELADSGLLIEEWGGDVVCVPVSARMKRGINDLLENILLVADINPPLSSPEGHAIGTVIESENDPRRGAIATLLVQTGTVRVGDPIVAGGVAGRVRAMFDDRGNALDAAPPSMPVRVMGFSTAPTAGSTFKVTADYNAARTEAEAWQVAHRVAAAAPIKLVSLEDVFQKMQAGQVKELNLILKADFQGSLEPIVNSLNRLSNDEVKIKILHQGVGKITESDINLAAASSAIVIGFNASLDGAAQNVAETQGVDVRTYDVIYNLLESVELALKGMLEPVYKEASQGEIEVRQVFHLSKKGTVAGCIVRSGFVTRGSLIRIKRGDQLVATTRMQSLKRFQEDVSDVKAGFECGVTLEKFEAYESGDILEAYKMERVR